MKIAIIGVGSVGASLGERLCQAGFEVRFGVRAGRDVSDLVTRCGDRAVALPVAEACGEADLVFLAVPFGVVVDTTRSAGDLTGKILVDCTNPVGWDDGPVVAPTLEGSVTATLVREFPGVRVVKGFNTFGSEFHLDPRLGEGAVDTYLASDDADAKAQVARVGEQAGFTVVDAGPLRNAALLENLAVLWIHLAMVGGQGRDVAFKLLRRT
jgi:predicted dinucleotide-binding enzyme